MLIIVLRGPVAAEDVKARGVNPAENDTRADLIVKYNALTRSSGIFTTTLKFDYRLSQDVGLNLEMPVLGHFRRSSPGPGLPGLNEAGTGDVFLRVRYVTGIGAGSLGQTSIGGAIEAVFPTASNDTLGSGTVQLNASALLVQAWNASLITAFVVKSTHSVHELHGRRAVQEHSARVVQAFILPHGMFATLDAKYNWETINNRDNWWEGQIEFGMMLDARTSASLGIGRKWGSREDRGSVSATVKRFF
ncbi:hypothetical protein [Bosea sp. (in: a-proteobacteria)]|uniref:hypothetical protein n=1 Tax=Bosea sp. (in: a-proteobacteria) TaxID=1871050 RepID=UPI0025BC7820|nr:hypothetical protein [Bosea sp. (in: a-proteobacteria)]